MNTPSTFINIFILKIHSIENASSANIGQNFLADWNHSDKTSQECPQNRGDSFTGGSDKIELK